MIEVVVPLGNETVACSVEKEEGNMGSSVGIALAQSQNGTRILEAASWYLVRVAVGKVSAMLLAICCSFCYR